MSTGRQRRLREVGDAGQARLAAAHVDPPVSGPAREVALEYLHRAGVGRVGAGGLSVPADVAALGLRHAAARDVAEGALAALVAIRAVLL